MSFDKSIFSMDIQWENTGGLDINWATVANGHTCRVRLNNFPDEPMYTLFIAGEEIADFDEWPENWSRPPRPMDDGEE